VVARKSKALDSRCSHKRPKKEGGTEKTETWVAWRNLKREREKRLSRGQKDMREERGGKHVKKDGKEL